MNIETNIESTTVLRIETGLAHELGNDLIKILGSCAESVEFYKTHGIEQKNFDRVNRLATALVST